MGGSNFRCGGGRVLGSGGGCIGDGRGACCTGEVGLTVGFTGTTGFSLSVLGTGGHTRFSNLMTEGLVGLLPLLPLPSVGVVAFVIPGFTFADSLPFDNF